MRVESEHGERLRTVLAGHPAPHRGPRRALLEASPDDHQPTVRRIPAPTVTQSFEPALPLTPVRPGMSRASSPVAITPPSASPAVHDLEGAEQAPAPAAMLARAKAFTAKHLQAIGILVVVALVFTSVQLLRARPSELPLAPETPFPAMSQAKPSPSPSAVALLQVHVLGAVHKPGVVQVSEGARVHDAIAAAGGLTAKAHLGSLNLAAPVSDGMQVMVASGPEQTSTTSADDQGPPAPPGSSGGPLVNLNTSTQAQLETLPGVGPSTAGKIIAWRDQHGKFSRVEELQEVDGIGPKTFERLRPLVTV